MNVSGILLAGMIGLFILAMGYVFIFILYQRKMISRDLEQQKLETEYQKRLLHSAIDSQEAERKRIAHDLHDEIGTLITTAKMYLGQITPQLEAVALEPLTGKMDSLLTETLDNVRRIAYDLRPVILENLGLAEAVESLSQKISSTKRVQVNFLNYLTASLNKESELILYRIIQELITNTLKHAKAENIEITMGIKNELFYIEYHDDGIGLLQQSEKHISGLGMKSIESRVNILEGTLTVLEKTRGTGLLIQVDYKRVIHYA